MPVGLLSCFSCVLLFVTLWAVACQAPMSMGFSRQEYWSGWLCPPPGDLSHPGIEPTSLTSSSSASFFTASATWEAPIQLTDTIKWPPCLSQLFWMWVCIRMIQYCKDSPECRIESCRGSSLRHLFRTDSIHSYQMQLDTQGTWSKMCRRDLDAWNQRYALLHSALHHGWELGCAHGWEFQTLGPLSGFQTLGP